jgi:small subunit ribosomal protein S20
LSAKKRMRQNVNRRGINRWRKTQVKETVRQFEEAVESGDKTKAAEQLKQVYKRLDKVAAGKTIHKNTAARKKSRLARRMNKAMA